MSYEQRTFIRALFFEKDDDFNLSWVMSLIFGLSGSGGFIWVVILSPLMGISVPIVVQMAAWTFITGAFASLLIAAVPYAKAKILVSTKLPVELAHQVSACVSDAVGSTDIQELSKNGEIPEPNAGI